MPSDQRTVLWEAKAAPGRDDDLVAFALQNAHPDAEIYRSPDARIVVIDRTGTGLPDPPNDLLARPVWDPLESTCRHASLSIL